jgi:cysteine-rich repeat protein
VTALLAAGIVLLALASPSAAAEKESRACRQTLGKEFGKLTATALKHIDACYKAKHKAAASPAGCNVVGSADFDPAGKYAAAKTKSEPKLDAKCLVGDPVLANYQGGDAFPQVVPALESGTTGNSVLVLGNQNLGDPTANKVDVKCIDTIAKQRTAIFKEIVKNSTKCQQALDKTATSFGALAASCVLPAAKAEAKAELGIQKACIDAGATSEAGSCFPLPECAVEASTAAAQTIVKAFYSTQPPPPPVCGDGTIESPEQCDDNNTTSGDGCSSQCEKEGPSCDAVPGSSVIGSRTVTIAVNAPQTLAGVQITLDYPQFQVGIPGTGQSSIVATRVAILQGNPGDYISVSNDRDTDMTFVIGAADNFINTGNLITVTMDSCVAKEQNLCNRNQNVIGCCDAATDTDGDLTFQECADFNVPPVCSAGSFPASSIGTGTPEDCCPGDNACVTQASATSCTVSGAVDSNGAPVDGVTCSVAIAGT